MAMGRDCPRGRAQLFAIAALTIAACDRPAPQPVEVTASSRAPRLELVGRMGDGPWSHYRVQSQARRVDVFAAHDQRPMPVVIMFQGSECYPLFVIHEDGKPADTSIFQDSIPARLNSFHFVHVEKQGVVPLRFKPGMSTAQ